MNMTERKINRIRDLSFWLPICIFLSAYIVPGTSSASLGKIILFMWAFINFAFDDHFKIRIDNSEIKLLLFILCYMIIDQFLVIGIYSTANSVTIFLNLAMNVLGIFTIIECRKHIDKERLYAIYLLLAIISMCGLYMQAVQVYIFKMKVSSLSIPGLNMILPVNNWNYDLTVRPRSFFAEPQAYCSFMAPFVIMALDKKKYALSLIASFSIILTTSTTGIFLVVAIWLYWAIFRIKRYYLKVAFIAVFSILSFIFASSEFFAYSLNKINNTTLTTNIRTGYAFEILRHMPIKDLLLGVGDGNLAYYLMDNSSYFSSIYFSLSGYVTTAFGLYICYGLVCGVAYMILCARMIKNGGKISRLIAILILITSFTQTIAFNSWGILWFSVYFIIYKNEKLLTTEERKN